jgi:hypothetical protein
LFVVSRGMTTSFRLAEAMLRDGFRSKGSSFSE